MLTRASVHEGRSAAYLRYALGGQRLVEGWLNELGLILVDEADGVQRRFDVHGHVAEIGVHHGRLFILLSLVRRAAENAVALDLFEDQHLNVDLSGKGDRARFERNLRRWDPRHEDVRIVKCDSWTLDAPRLRELAGGDLRLVSVDGGHTAPLTQHDLTTACDALGSGGIVVLDDCFNDFFPSVAEGALQFFRERTDFVPFVTGGNKTLICHEAWAERYMDAFRTWAPHYPCHGEERMFLGRPIFAMQVFPERYGRTQYWWRYGVGRAAAAIHRR